MKMKTKIILSFYLDISTFLIVSSCIQNLIKDLDAVIISVAHVTGKINLLHSISKFKKNRASPTDKTVTLEIRGIEA